MISSPILDGIEKAEVELYTTSFGLDVPGVWDVPMDFAFNGTEGSQFVHRGMVL